MSEHPIYLVLIVVLVVAGFGSAAMAAISMWEDLLDALRSRSDKERNLSR